MVSDGGLEGDHALSTERILAVHVEVALGVARRPLALPPHLPALEAGRGGDKQSQHHHGPAADHHVQHRHPELEGAVGFLFVEAGRAMAGAVAPKGSVDAGVQFGASAKVTNKFRLYVMTITSIISQCIIDTAIRDLFYLKQIKILMLKG